MGFFNKFGNFVEDAASFAIPAGLALAGTAATGGLGAIGTPQLVSALGAGAGGFARNEEEERRKKMLAQQARNQGMANLQNALSPGTNAQAKQADVPKSGFLETSSRGVGQGIQAFQAAEALMRKNKFLDTQQEEAKGNLEKLRRDALEREGRNLAASGQALPSAPLGEAPIVSDPHLSAAFEREASRIEAFNQAQRLQKEDRELAEKAFTREGEILDAERERNRLLKASSDKKERRDYVLSVIRQVVEINPSIKGSDDVAKSYVRIKAIVPDLLNPDSKARGAGQFALLNLFNKGFVDENAAVREADIANLKAAQSLVQQMGLKLKNISEGDIISEDLVRQIDASVDILYGAYREALIHNVEDQLSVEIADLSPSEIDDALTFSISGVLNTPVRDFTGRADQGNNPLEIAAVEHKIAREAVLKLEEEALLKEEEEALRKEEEEALRKEALLRRSPGQQARAAFLGDAASWLNRAGESERRGHRRNIRPTTPRPKNSVPSYNTWGQRTLSGTPDVGGNNPFAQGAALDPRQLINEDSPPKNDSLMDLSGNMQELIRRLMEYGANPNRFDQGYRSNWRQGALSK